MIHHMAIALLAVPGLAAGGVLPGARYLGERALP